MVKRGFVNGQFQFYHRNASKAAAICLALSHAAKTPSVKRGKRKSGFFAPRLKTQV